MLLRLAINVVLLHQLLCLQFLADRMERLQEFQVHQIFHRQEYRAALTEHHQHLHEFRVVHMDHLLEFPAVHTELHQQLLALVQAT